MYRLPAVRIRPCRPCRRHLRSHPCLCSTNWQAAWRPDPRHGCRAASYRTSCRIGSMYTRRRTCIPVCTGNTRSFRKNRTGRGRPCLPRGTAFRTSWPGRPARTTVTWPPRRPMRFRTLSDVSCSSSLSSHLRATSASCGDRQDGPIRRARTDGRTICLFALLPAINNPSFPSTESNQPKPEDTSSRQVFCLGCVMGPGRRRGRPEEAGVRNQHSQTDKQAWRC